MALTDTTSTPVFIDWQPDWSKRVSLVTKWKTLIKPNREAGEQRARISNSPRLSLVYAVGAMKPLSFSIRRAMAMQQLGATVVVPVWTEYMVASSFATNSVTATAAITSLKFKVGSWIYVIQGANACFRKITSVATPTINLSSGGSDIYPTTFTWAVFSAGARVYPCILGSRNGNAYGFKNNRVDRKDHLIEVEEL